MDSACQKYRRQGSYIMPYVRVPFPRFIILNNVETTRRLPPLQPHPRVVSRRLRLHAWPEIASPRMHMHNARVFKRRQYLVRNANQQTRECATNERRNRSTRGSGSDRLGRGRRRTYTWFSDAHSRWSLWVYLLQAHLKASLATKIGSPLSPSWRSP